MADTRPATHHTAAPFAGLERRAICWLLALPILPHYLNDIYLVLLHRWYVRPVTVGGAVRPMASTEGIWWMWSLDFVVYLGIPLVIMWHYARRGWFPWAAYGFRPGQWLPGIAVGLGLALLGWLPMALAHQHWGDWLGGLLPHVSYAPFFVGKKAGVLAWLLVSLYIALGAGFLEEYLYRAFLIRGLERVGLRPWQAGGVAIVVFVFIHAVAGVYVWLVALWVGLVFTVYYIRFRNIYPLVVAHVAIDLFWASGLEGRLFAAIFQEAQRLPMLQTP